jgi:hypothetical protein
MFAYASTLVLGNMAALLAEAMQVAGSIRSLIIPAPLSPGIYSASNRNEYQKQKINMFLGSRTWPASKADGCNTV